MHLHGVGIELLEVNLRGSPSVTDSLDRIRAFIELHSSEIASAGELPPVGFYGCVSI